MQPEPMRCSDCRGEMEPGYVPDMAYGAIMNQRWVPGSPEKHWFAGLKVDWSDCRLLEAYRCKGCGLLKFYANALAGSPGSKG